MKENEIEQEKRGGRGGVKKRGGGKEEGRGGVYAHGGSSLKRTVLRNIHRDKKMLLPLLKRNLF